MEHIYNPDSLDDLLEMFLVRQKELPAQAQTQDIQSALVSDESVPEFPRFTEGSNKLVKKCSVTLKPLSHVEMEAWSKPNDTLNKESYNLCQQKCNINVPTQNTYTSHYGRAVKRIVNPIENPSVSSQDNDDDTSVKPSRWSQPRQRNIHIPLGGGPSASRLKAQNLIQKQKEQAAAQALLGLHQQNVTSDNTNSSVRDQDELSSETVDIDTESSSATPTESDSDDYSDSDEVPLAKLKNDHANTSNSHSDSDEVPLVKLKEKSQPTGKPYFKTKSYELYKRKRQRVFKCLKCDWTEKSQKKINEHYCSTHGLLTLQ